MRSIPIALEEKIEKLMQTIYEDADPWMDIVAQKTERFIAPGTLLAPVTIRTGSSLGPFQIAVRREDSNLDPSELVMAYIQNGEVRVATLPYFPAPNETWTYRYTIGAATDIGIDFDGWWQYITERTGIYYDTTVRWVKVSTGDPWIAYVTPTGALLCQQGRHGAPFTVAADGVTKVAVHRGWKNVILANHDHGLVIAYIRNSEMRYRTYAQQADGVTMLWEAERVRPEIPTPVQNLALFRTNDYRFGFLGESNGQIYQAVSLRNWAGMAVPEEKVRTGVKNLLITFREITRIIATTTERVAATLVLTLALLYALSDNAFTQAKNDGDLTVHVTTRHFLQNPVAADLEVRDIDDISYSVARVTPDQSDPSKLTLHLDDSLNYANQSKDGAGPLTIKFLGSGATKGEAGQDVHPFQTDFIPNGLEFVALIPPAVVNIWNEG